MVSHVSSLVFDKFKKTFSFSRVLCDSTTHFVGPSIGPSIGLSVSPSVGLSGCTPVGQTLVEIMKKRLFFLGKEMCEPMCMHTDTIK